MLPTDLKAVRKWFDAVAPCGGRQTVLEDARQIPATVTAAPTFASSIFTDDAGHAVFPHYDSAGDLCGYEIEGETFTGFSPGGLRGLWAGEPDPGGTRHLVIAESAVEAMTYAAVAGRPLSRYASTGGTLATHEQRRRIAALVKAAMLDSTPACVFADVVLVVSDEDSPATKRLVAVVSAAASEASRRGGHWMGVRVDSRPLVPGKRLAHWPSTPEEEGSPAFPGAAEW